MPQVLNCKVHSKLQVLKCMHRPEHKVVHRLGLTQVRLTTTQVRIVVKTRMFRMLILRRSSDSDK